MAIQLIILFVLNLAALSWTCSLMSITECNKFDYVSTNKFRAFISRAQYEETCSNMRIVLDCIYQPKYMAGCTAIDTFFYDMQRDVSNKVCTGGDYMKHVSCLGSKEMEDKVAKDCMSAIASSTPDCEIIKSVRSCVSSLILSACGTDDSSYIDMLIYTFLKPFANTIHCQMSLPEYGMSTTPGITAGMGSTTKASSTRKSTSGTTHLHTTPKSGSTTVTSSISATAITIAMAVIARF